MRKCYYSHQDNCKDGYWLPINVLWAYTISTCRGERTSPTVRIGYIAATTKSLRLTVSSGVLRQSRQVRFVSNSCCANRESIDPTSKQIKRSNESGAHIQLSRDSNFSTIYHLVEQNWTPLCASLVCWADSRLRVQWQAVCKSRCFEIARDIKPLVT
jgi:hypothetical protein